MNTLFEHTSASWVRYSDYEWKECGGILYLLPTADAQPRPYDPMKTAETLVMDAMDIGLLCFQKKPDTEIQAAIREFACKYGLLGIMTALPTTAKFVEYEKVYLPKNELIRVEAMDTTAYLDLFFPFKKPDFIRSISGHCGIRREGLKLWPAPAGKHPGSGLTITGIPV